MSLKDELVLILCIWCHFIVYKMFFSVSLLDSFHTHLLTLSSVPGILLGDHISVNKMGKSMTWWISVNVFDLQNHPRWNPWMLSWALWTWDLSLCLGPVSFLPLNVFATYFLLISVLNASRLLSAEVLGVLNASWRWDGSSLFCMSANLGKIKMFIGI